MNKIEVRFSFDTSSLKIVKFNTLENARNFCEKVKRTAERANKHGKLAVWNNGWLEMSEIF